MSWYARSTRKLSKQLCWQMQTMLMRFWSSDNLGLVHPSHLFSSINPTPHSGKSLFLVWLLIRRLALRLPTALQIRSDEALLFHEGGVSLFRNLLNNGAYLGLGFNNPSSKIWVLVDSSPNLPEPAPVFRAGEAFFVVEAASREHRLEWCKKIRSQAVVFYLSNKKTIVTRLFAIRFETKSMYCISFLMKGEFGMRESLCCTTFSFWRCQSGGRVTRGDQCARFLDVCK